MLYLGPFTHLCRILQDGYELWWRFFSCFLTVAAGIRSLNILSVYPDSKTTWRSLLRAGNPDVLRIFHNISLGRVLNPFFINIFLIFSDKVYITRLENWSICISDGLSAYLKRHTSPDPLLLSCRLLFCKMRLLVFLILVSNYYFSDMQIDQFSKRVIYTLSENIKKIFIKNGFKTLPRLILWNMRKTSGFPARSNDRHVVLLSGYTDKMFKLLMPAPTVRKQLKKRHHSSYPSWSILQRCVNGPRYNILHNKIISKI